MSGGLVHRVTAGRAERQPDLPLVPVAAVMGLALMVGGAGFTYPLINGAIEICSLALLCWIGCTRPLLPFALSRLTVIFALILLLIPVVQLLPLPPSLSARLPGRELPDQVLRLSGLAQAWRPISLEPQATVRSALSFAAPCAIFIGSLHLAQRDRARLVGAFIAIAFVSVALGALQRTTGGNFTIFETEHASSGPGLFVNRNHQAAFLLTAAVMLAAVSRSGAAGGARLGPKAALALILLLFAGVVSTTSRMGLVVMPFAAVASFLILFPLRLRFSLIAISLCAVGLVGLLAFETSGGQLVIERFVGALTDERLGFWTDTRDGIGQFWPIGTGLGTFRRVYPLFEDLSVVSPLLVNNAHNDYLELVLECGVAGVALILLVIVWLSVAAVKLSRRPRSDPLAVGALVCLGLLALHSLVDYPVRMASIATTVGLFAALIEAERRPLRSRGQPSPGSGDTSP